MSEWIEWKGGDCPVDPDERVDVKFQDEITSYQKAKWFYWHHDGDCADITAYRLSKANGDKDE